MTPLKKIDNAIATFTTNRNKLRDSAHEIAMLIFMHAAPQAVSPDCAGTGDCTRAVKLVQAMPTSWGTQMVDWFKANTPIRMNVKTGTCRYDPAYSKLSDAEKLARWDIVTANTVPFHETSVEAPVRDSEFNLAAVIRLVEAIGKKYDKAKDDNRLNADDAEAVTSAVAVLRALRFVAPEKPIVSNDTMAADDTSVVAA